MCPVLYITVFVKKFHDAKVTSDGGLLAYRDLDHALGLFESVSATFQDNRTGRNIHYAMPTLLRQSIYRRLAGYEDVNDAERLSIDPVMRAITGKKVRTLFDNYHDAGAYTAVWDGTDDKGGPMEITD